MGNVDGLAWLENSTGDSHVVGESDFNGLQPKPDFWEQFTLFSRYFRKRVERSAWSILVASDMTLLRMAPKSISEVISETTLKNSISCARNFFIRSMNWVLWRAMAAWVVKASKRARSPLLNCPFSLVKNLATPIYLAFNRPDRDAENAFCGKSRALVDGSVKKFVCIGIVDDNTLACGEYMAGHPAVVQKCGFHAGNYHGQSGNTARSFQCHLKKIVPRSASHFAGSDINENRQHVIQRIKMRPYSQRRAGGVLTWWDSGRAPPVRKYYFLSADLLSLCFLIRLQLPPAAP